MAQSSTLCGPASLLTAFEVAAVEAGFTVGVASVRGFDRPSVTRAIERPLDQRVAGIVVIAPVQSASDAISDYDLDVPVVAIDGDPKTATGLVMVDQREGARLATQGLLDAGHDTVWQISGPLDWHDSQGRLEGWRCTLEAARAEVPPPLTADWSPASGYTAGQMLARMPAVSAVFAANDHLALGLLHALREHGRAVPEDVSIIGFDDILEAAYLALPLTTVRPDFDEVARASLELLLSQIEAGADSRARGAERRVLVPELVQRDSVRSRLR